jgi:hypothetical protein
MDIIEKINILMGEDRMAGLTGGDKKSYERKKYRMTKHKKKKSLEKLKGSSEGNKQKNSKDRLAKGGRTPTRKAKKRYHV